MHELILMIYRFYHMNVRQYLLAFLLLSFGFIGSSQEQLNQGVFETEPELIVLFYYADWCQPCKKLAPKLAAVQEELTDERVKHLRFNLTNAETMENTKLLALENDIPNYVPLERATGFAIVIDTESKEQVGFITTLKSNEEIVELIQMNL